MRQPNDLSRSLAPFDQDTTLIAVIEMSQSSWLVAGMVPGLERHPLKKLAVDEGSVLRLLQRWRDEAIRAGRRIERIAVAFEAGRDGFWLARWLQAHDIEVAFKAQQATGREQITALADRGYFNGDQVLLCEGTGVAPVVPKTLTSGNVKRGLFTGQDFIYDAEKDHYTCPAVRATSTNTVI